MPARRRRSPIAAVVALLLLVAVPAGCGSETEDGDAGGAAAASEPTAASAPPYDPMPWKAPAGAASRCGPQPQRVASMRLRPLVLRAPGDARLPAVTAGRGDTVAVLLHQTDGGGYCGWLPFAEELVRRGGVTVLAPDLCGYGEARCREGYSYERQTDQVRLAVDHAAQRLAAERIVLVGASMGGSLAVLTAAEEPRVDAVVDLSGPPLWRHRSLEEAAARLTAPALVAAAEDDGAEEFAASRAVAEAAPPGSEFVAAPTGHGYELLAGPDGRPTALAGQVLAWVRGER